MSLSLKIIPSVACLALAVTVIAPEVCAQAVSGAEISGLVSDPSGSPIANAMVQLTQTETNASHKAITDSAGRYALPNLPIGPSRLEVSAAGFKVYTQSGILLQVGDNVQVNVAMQIGSVTERVEVTASASMVETTENAVSQVIDSGRIRDLPLNGRQPTQLILLTGAAVPAPVGDMGGPKAFYSSVTISVAGGQSGGINYLLDGGDHNDSVMNINLPFPFPDALQEFSVQTSTVPARFGLHPGGVVNAVTKSGTNDWHGNVFEFLRNGDFNARNFFAPTHDSLKRNQFGGTIGGRVIRDRLFFFGGYQNTINKSDPPSTIGYTPTQAVMHGDFSTIDSGACVAGGKGKTLIDPTTGQPFAQNNVIPLSRFNPQAVNAVTNFIPVSTNPCGQLTYGIAQNTNESQYTGRVDYVQNSKHTLYGRYFITNYANPAVFDGKNLLQTTKVGNVERAQTTTFGDTYTFTPTTVNSFHATATRVRDNRGSAPNDISPATLGLDIFSFTPHFIQFAVNNYFSVGNGTGAPADFNRNSYAAADDLDIIRGKHQISFGADVIRDQFNSVNGYIENGNYTFNGQSTNDSLADFMLGLPSNFTQSNPLQNYSRQWVIGLYVQDSIKVSPRLQINAGLRWEPTLPPTDREGSTFSMAGFAAGVKSKVFTNAPPGLLFFGDPGVPAPYSFKHLDNFSPRLGLVWDPRGDGRQTIRVSGSILRDTAMLFYPERLTTNAPYAGPISLSSLPGGFTNPYLGYAGGSPFPAPTPRPANIAFSPAGVYYNMPLHLNPTYAAQWSVALQRQITPNWLVSATYLGSKTTHIWDAQELNPAVYIPGMCSGKACSTTGNTNQRRVTYLLNPVTGAAYANIDSSDQGANSHYQGLLFSLQHRLSNNFTVLSNYTYSHCISNGDIGSELGGPTYENPNNRAQDRGNCNFDIRHNFNLSVIAVSPIRGTDWRGRILSQWQFAPIVTVRSGTVLNVTTGTDNSLTGVGLDRPNVVGGVSPYRANAGGSGWLDPAAFVPNITGTFGNLGHDALYGPKQINMDLALSRIFRIRDRFELEARGEAFNFINHTNFSALSVSSLAIVGITTALNSSTFGKPQSAGDPRILQFALKFRY
jgi:Carboxypeptidase regulatory-like domain/TonB dependent receptor